MIWLALILILCPFIAITAYIVVTAAKAVVESGHKLSWWVKAVVIAWGVPGIVCDVIYNATWAWFRFKERPKELLLTSRLKRYRTYPDGDWRKQRAIRGWTWLNYFETEHW